MTSIVVVADCSDARALTHLIWLPFRPLATGLIIILDISGKLPGPESLEELNVVELIVIGPESTPLDPADEICCNCTSICPLSGFEINCQLCNTSTPEVVHVSSNWSPIWHTGAIMEGEISTSPTRLSRNSKHRE